jgi:hypothetical protein
MDFLAPLMLLGAAGVALPIVIHLFGRRRARVVRFAALDFLLGSDRKTARRLELRQLLLLLLRVLVCLAIPLVLAKPYASCASGPAHVTRGAQAAVLIIDDSFATSYRDGDETLLDRARQRARDLLSQMGPEAEVAVVLTAEGSSSPSELSRDHLKLRDRIRRLRPSFRPADTSAALRRAALLLSSSRHARRTVYLLSLLSATGFRGDAAWPADSGIGLTVLPLAGERPLDNLAITGLEIAPARNAGPRGLQVTALVENFGSTAVRDHGIALRLGDRVVARGFVSVEPRARSKKRFSASLPQGTRRALVSALLDPDRLEVDNQRHALAHLGESIRLLLVDGDPRTVRHEDELFYLEAALRPGDQDSGTTLVSIVPDELAHTDLSAHDVVVLANVNALPAASVAALDRWPRAGGGLLVTMGNQVAPEAYARTMMPLLPQALQSVIDTGHGAAPGEQEARALRLSKLEVDHPIFAPFTSDAPGLRGALFARAMLLGPTTAVEDRRVLARFTSGAAALIEARSGRGRMLLFTSSIDRDWNDLPIQPGFLPLAQEMVRYLGGKAGERNRGLVLIGHGATIPISPQDRRIEITGPDGQRDVIEGDALSDRKVLRFTRSQQPGLYRVRATDENEVDVPRPEADFVANLDPRGSDLRPVSSALLAAHGRPAADSSPAPAERRVELWHALAAALLLFLVCESLLALR